MATCRFPGSNRRRCVDFFANHVHAAAFERRSGSSEPYPSRFEPRPLGYEAHDRGAVDESPRNERSSRRSEPRSLERSVVLREDVPRSERMLARDFRDVASERQDLGRWSRSVDDTPRLEERKRFCELRSFRSALLPSATRRTRRGLRATSAGTSATASGSCSRRPHWLRALARSVARAFDPSLAHAGSPVARPEAWLTCTGASLAPLRSKLACVRMSLARVVVSPVLVCACFPSTDTSFGCVVRGLEEGSGGARLRRFERASLLSGARSRGFVARTSGSRGRSWACLARSGARVVRGAGNVARTYASLVPTRASRARTCASVARTDPSRSLLVEYGGAGAGVAHLGRMCCSRTGARNDRHPLTRTCQARRVGKPRPHHVSSKLREGRANR